MMNEKSLIEQMNNDKIEVFKLIEREVNSE